jgi:hypothetical protein
MTWKGEGESLGLARPFVGGVEADLGTQPRHRRGEIQIIDRRVLDHDRIPRRVHARGHGPDHVLPVAGVHVVVHHDDELGVHELAQERPDAQHHPLGVAGILLAHGDHRQPVGAALRRQVEVDDFGKLLLQDRHEHLVQRHAENRRFVRRPAGVGAVIDRLLAVGDAVDGEHREAIHFVVIAGVVAERSFQRGFVGDGCGLPARIRRWPALQLAAQHCATSVREPRSRPAKAYSDKRIRHRRHRARMVAGSAPSATAMGNGSPGRASLPVAEIQRPAAMRQPAHDDLVAPDHLLAVDAQILPRFVRPRVTTSPQVIKRPGIPRPAMLHRQPRQIDRGFDHPLLTRRPLDFSSGPCPAPV